MSDVYSLGALLYELLTGGPPHRFAGRSPTTTQVSEIVGERAPRRPSLAARDPEMRRRLRGDLDTILLCALAQEPERRYRGAGQLADDLRRYLAHEPVEARPDTLPYRARKFLQRNRSLTAAAALLFLALLGGLLATAHQARIATRERHRAERRFGEVRRLANSLLFDLHNAIAEIPGALRARQMLTERAVEYLDSLAAEAGDDLSLRSELAAAYDKIGSLTFNLREARAAHERAVHLAEAVVQAAPENASYRRQLSESYDQLSDVLKIAGDSQGAIALARKSLAILPAGPAFALARAERHAAVAIALLNAGDFRAALEEVEAARALEDSLGGEERESRRRRLGLQLLAAEAHSEAGDFAEALALANAATAAAEALAQEEPGNSRHLRDLWSTRFRRGRIYAAMGQPVEALADLRSAVEYLEGLAAADPNDIGHRRWLGVTYGAIGRALAATGDRAEAERFLEKGRAIAQQLVTDDPQRVEAQLDLVEIERALGELPAATPAHLSHAAQLAETLLAEDPANVRLQTTVAALRAECAPQK